MGSHWFNKAAAEILKAYLVTGKDVRVILCMSNTTADTENDAKVYVGDLTTLDECNGTNYVRKALANEAANVDDGNDRGEFIADAITWSALGAGTRQTVGALFYNHVTNDANSPVLFWMEFASPVTHSGIDFVLTPNAEGLAQARVV